VNTGSYVKMSEVKSGGVVLVVSEVKSGGVVLMVG